MSVKDTEYFKNLLKKVIKEKNLNKKIVSVFGYGSFFSDKRSKESDVDIYVVISRFDFSILKSLREIKLFLEKKIKRKVFINILSKEDLPTNSLFYHRDREIIFSLDFFRNFCVIYGRKEYKDDCFFFMMRDLVDECVRNMHVLLYISKKSIINDDKVNTREIAKNFIKALRYLNLLNGIYTYNVDETIHVFLSLVNKPITNYMKKLAPLIKKHRYREIVSNVQKTYYQDRCSENIIKEMLGLFHTLVYFSINYFKKYPFFDYTRSCRVNNICNLRVKIYDSKEKNFIIFLPGVPNNPREDFLWSCTSYGNILVVLNENFVEFIKHPYRITYFFENIRKIIKSYKIDTAILSSFSTLFIGHIGKIDSLRKILVLSPILEINEDVEKKLRDAIKELLSSLGYRKIAESVVKKFISKFATNFVEEYKKISDLNKKILVAYSSLADKEVCPKKIVEELKKVKNVRIFSTRKNLHGYKLLLDFDVWSETVKFFENK